MQAVAFVLCQEPAEIITHPLSIQFKVRTQHKMLVLQELDVRAQIWKRSKAKPIYHWFVHKCDTSKHYTSNSCIDLAGKFTCKQKETTYNILVSTNLAIWL